jgi:hypothetical protein
MLDFRLGFSKNMAADLKKSAETKIKRRWGASQFDK